MYSTLSPGAIGVKTKDLSDLVAKAKSAKFKGAEFSVGEAADLIDREGVAAVHGLFTKGGVIAAGWGLPTNWRGDEAAWRADLEKLPRLAKAGAALGAKRTFTWILSWDDNRPDAENWKFHVDRFTPIARILADHGVGVGLEFLGPKTLYKNKAHEFIHSLERMVELCVAIGPNAGLLLDCWHWHASGGTVEAIRKLTPERVVYVHVNDAPSGVALDDLVDNRRCLPGETGVIDIAGFLQALKAIGYDGPVTPEPFKKELNALPSDEERLRVVSAAMADIFRKAGIPA
jgi:sugar phosphate isomerase/epimerase